MWINVPEIKPTEGREANKDAITATGMSRTWRRYRPR